VRIVFHLGHSLRARKRNCLDLGIALIFSDKIAAEVSNRRRGPTNRVIIVAANRPPITARPSGAFCSEPDPRLSAIGSIPRIIAIAGHDDRSEADTPLLSTAAATEPKPSLAQFVGEGDQQVGVGDADSDRHDRAQSATRH